MYSNAINKTRVYKVGRTTEMDNKFKLMFPTTSADVSADISGDMTLEQY